MTEQEMAQRQAASMRQVQAYQDIYRLQTIAPDLVRSIVNMMPVYIGMEADLRFIQMTAERRAEVGEERRCKEDYEEAMREVDEIAPGWKD